MSQGSPPTTFDALAAEWHRGQPAAEADIKKLERIWSAAVRAALWGDRPNKWALFGIVSGGENLLRMSRWYWGENAEQQPQHRRLVEKVVRGYQEVRERFDRGERIDAALERLADSSVSAPPGPKPGKAG